MARNAGAAARPQSIGSRWLKALSGLVKRTRRKPDRHSRLTLHLMRIRREVICHQIQHARKKHQKAPFDRARSLTHEILRQELANGRG